MTTDLIVRVNIFSRHMHATAVNVHHFFFFFLRISSHEIVRKIKFATRLTGEEKTGGEKCKK